MDFRDIDIQVFGKIFADNGLAGPEELLFTLREGILGPDLNQTCNI